VTRAEARRALDDFIEHRLPKFGTYEDAMWTEQPFLYHALLSSSLNLKLISPKECVEKAIDAYHDGHAAMNNVEGFVRQLIGWREYIRGVYFTEGPDYPFRNGLNQQGDLPEFYWTGDTDMRCLRECLGSVVEHAYSHHIPRLMVIGNFALIAGVDPRQVHEWFLAMYVDAVEWATAPNVVGMAEHADRRPDAEPGETGVVGTKPYAASGKYINRMSNFCKHCRYDVNTREGDDACPFNVLYWDFLIRHRDTFASNNRMAMILKNVDRMSKETKTDLTVRGQQIRDRFGIGSPSG
jgi:deoxyribodipyrimidine photolyase-related protein